MISTLLLALKNWKAVAVSFITLLFAGMWGMLTLRTKQLEEAKAKNDAFELKDKISTQQHNEALDIIEQEQDDIIEELNNNAQKSKDERIDNL